MRRIKDEQTKMICGDEGSSDAGGRRASERRRVLERLQSGDAGEAMQNVARLECERTRNGSDEGEVRVRARRWFDVSSEEANTSGNEWESSFDSSEGE